MKQILTFFLVLLTCGLATAQIVYDGHRMLVHNADGSVTAYVVDSIQDLQFDTIANAKVTITSLGSDDASIRARITMGTGCKRYQVACFAAADSIKDMQQYIIANNKCDRKASGSVEFIDLVASTDYVVAALAYDAYGLPCEVTTLTITTAQREQSAPAKVGDYLYSDGSWSTELKTNKSVVAIVTSITPTSADVAKGYTHGYAMAVNEAGTAAWTLQGNENESGSMIDSTADLTDREGLTRTTVLLADADNHPAALTAQSFAKTPQGTSGWFLPATGQLVEMFTNIGGLDMSQFSRNSGIATWPKAEAAKCQTAVNARLAVLGDGNYTPMNQKYYWTSSEHSVATTYYLFINSDYNMSLQNYYKDGKFTVRPFIAF